MQLYDFGFTGSWWESFWRYKVRGTKRIKLAVVGSNSHGKSYLLFDLIHAFDLLGFRTQAPSLNFPYRRLEGYFQNISTSNGCVVQTSRYPCRQENHYGAVLVKPGTDLRIDVEFLNIPGEAFNPNLSSIGTFFDIKDALERTKKGVFTVTTWRNRAGEEQYVVEPVQEVRNSNGRPRPDDNPTGIEVKQEDLNKNYLDWARLFAHLRKLQFEPQPATTRDITGKTLIRNFFKYQPDSVIRSIIDAWDSTPTSKLSISKDDFENNNYDKDFYFHMYCLDATDIVVCDKLFAPKGTQATDAEKIGALGYVDLMRQLSGFLSAEHRENKAPNVFLAFRGADMLLNEERLQQLSHALQGLPSELRDNAIYSTFLHQLLCLIDPNGNSYQRPTEENLCKWLGASKADAEVLKTDILDNRQLTTLTDNNLAEHISTRMGNQTSGLWQLLQTVSSEGLDQQARNSLHLPIAPHVFFTSTPIDSLYRIYEPDSENQNQRFVRTDPKTGQVVAQHTVGQYLSFGTTQLCMDLLIQNGVSESLFRIGGLLHRLFFRLK